MREIDVDIRIPKIIHYCWFGGKPLPEMAQKCIDSWQKFCPDYEIIEWNENNFDVNYCDYVSEAYMAQKWAFVSDVARLYALVNYGGVYMDTDVELVHNIDCLLRYKAVSGFESQTEIPTGLIASIPHHILFEELLAEYDDAHFLRDDRSYDVTTNVVRITNTCLKYGLIQNNMFQEVNGFTLLPKDYLCPKDYLTGEIRITENTLAIHHFNGSWVSEDDRLFTDIMKRYPSFMDKNVIRYMCKFYCVYKCYGLRRAKDLFIGWIKRKKNED